MTGSSADQSGLEAALRERTEAAEMRHAGARPPIWGLLLTIALIAVGWSHTFYEMWMRWYPGWDTRFGHANLTFTRRFTIGDSYYSHGPLVPLACLVMAWVIFKRVGAPVNRTRSATVLGWLLLVGSVAAHLMSVYARVMFVSGFALIGVLAALVMLWGGWTLLRAYGLPILFLLFMVPLPELLIAGLNFRLKFIAGHQALWLTNYIFNIPAVMDGSYVYLPDAPDGTTKMLVVENVCSGLRSLISLIWFAAMFAMVCRARGGWRFLMLLLAVPVAILCNTVRITTLNVGAHYWGIDVASEGATLHDMSGLLVFALALAMLFSVESLIVWSGRKLGRNWSDRRLMGYLESVRGREGAAPALARPGVLLLLVFVAAVSVYWSRASAAINRGDMARHAVPTRVTIDGVDYAGTDVEMDAQTLAILETNDYLYRRFEADPARRAALDPARRTFDLLIVFSPDNRKGTHPPDVCLEGGGAIITSKRLHALEPLGMERLKMKELITQSGSAAGFFVYVYKCGDRYTPSFWVQQATIFLNGLTQRNAAGALIRISMNVPPPTSDVEPSRAMALDASRTLLPIIDRNLP